MSDSAKKQLNFAAPSRLPRVWKCPQHGAPVVCGCSRCTSIAKLLIETVGFGVARSREQLRLAAELVLRYAADFAAAHPRRRALPLAAEFYVTAVPL